MHAIVRMTLEMIERDRSHPSVIIWSLANESQWGPNFKASFKAAQEADPSRPKSFHDQSWGGYNNRGSSTQIANFHYPGPGGPEREWLEACKGGAPGLSSFDYSGPQTEFLMLGNVATQFEGPLEYDPLSMKITNSPEADALLKCEYRRGWSL